MKVASDALLAMPIEMDVPTPLEDAVEQMTDSWIDDGQYCGQTVFDLRDALREALIILKANAALRRGEPVASNGVLAEESTTKGE
jgi:hypothetical protein